MNNTSLGLVREIGKRTHVLPGVGTSECLLLALPTSAELNFVTL